MADYEDLLAGPPSNGEDLRAIVARATGRRRLVGAAVGVVALVAGGGIGYAISDANQAAIVRTGVAGPARGQLRSQPATAPVSGGNVPAGVTASGVSGIGTGYSHLFDRVAGPVTIRAYLADPVRSESACAARLPAFQADVSTDAVAASLTDPGLGTDTASPVEAGYAGQVGTAEGHPADVVIVHTSAAVAKVRVSFDGGTVDSMAPVQGWAVLAAEVAGSGTSGSSAAPLAMGTLQALGSTGQVLQSSPVDYGAIAPQGVEPLLGCCGVAVPGAVHAATGSGVTGNAVPAYACPVEGPVTGPGVPASGGSAAVTPSTPAQG